MTCPHDDRLLDLVLGEMPPEDAAALRAEAAACPHCQDALAQLELGAAFAARMPMEAPPAGMDAVILKAAADKALAMADQRAEVPAVEPEPEPDRAVGGAVAGSLLDRLKDWISGITLGPQMAMASVMLLVVSIGLWYLPQVGGPDRVARTQVTPDPEGEAISALPELDPGEPATEGAEAPTVALNVDAEESVAEGEEPRAFEPPAERPGSNSGYRRGRGLGDRASGGGREARAPARQPARSQAPPRSQAPAPAPRDNAADSEPELERQARAAAQQAPVQAEQPLPSYGDSRDPASNAGAGSSYAEGVSSYRGGRYEAAEDEFRQALAESDMDTPQAQALPTRIHQLARSYRRNGDCRQAVTHYDDLLRRYPSYSQAPQALIEAADCRRRLGQLRQARQLLERAQRFASTQAAATRELRRIETLERASRRRSARPASVDAYEAAEAY